jgi:hypothetical protein
MRFKLFVLAFSVIILVSCDKNITEDSSSFIVSGNIYYNNELIDNATISIVSDTRDEFTTSSNEFGYFEFNSIPKGNHILTVSKSFEENSTIYSEELYVNENEYIDEILLPTPVSLLEPLEVTWTTITLNWSSFIEDQFYEYKVYRHTTSGLDENTGQLIHVATSVTDTTYFDDLSWEGQPSNNQTYYYRVYTSNMYGHLSGSNILEVTTNMWENEHNFTVEYELEELTNFPGIAGGVTGLDYDGEYLWLLCVTYIGGFYDPNIVNLIRYDYQTAEILSTFEYNDDITPPGALAWQDGYLWVAYNNTANQELRKIEPNTGEIVSSFNTPYGIRDISSDGENLFLNYFNNLIEKVDANNLSLLESFANPFGSGGNNGIAYKPGEIWLSDSSNAQLAIINENGTHIGVANTDLLSDWNAGLKLCFMNDSILILKDNRIYIMEILEISK